MPKDKKNPLKNIRKFEPLKMPKDMNNDTMDKVKK